MGLERNDLPLFDLYTECDDQGEVFDDEPAPNRHRSAGSRFGFRNHRRSIEELQEDKLLRSMLNDLEQDFPDL